MTTPNRAVKNSESPTLKVPSPIRPRDWNTGRRANWQAKPRRESIPLSAFGSVAAMVFGSWSQSVSNGHCVKLDPIKLVHCHTMILG